MLLAVVGMIREARIVQGPSVRAVAGGGRSDLLRLRLAANRHDITGVLSVGLGGALDPALQVGDVVLADEVISPAGRWTTDPAWTQRLAVALPAARRAIEYASDAMILKATDKAVLRTGTGAATVDMESHVAAAFAAENGLPFAVVRVVSDAAGDNLPRAVTAGMKPDGGVNLLGVLASLAADPRQLPGLIRTGKHAEIAFKALQALAPNLVA